MPFVVDTSVTMAWCFEDEASDETDSLLDRLRADVAIAPSLWRLEVANVLLVAERRKRLSEARAMRFLTLLDQLPIRIDSSPIDAKEIIAAGRRHSLSAYDSAYLVLAERLAMPVATLDAKLAAACLAAGVELLLEP